MRRLSVCTDGGKHVMDVRILDMTEIMDARCRYCGISWDDLMEALARHEFSSGVAEHEERDCGV